MSAILTTVLGGVLDKVIDKVTNQLPVTENEKANIKVEVDKELSKQAGAIAEAEAIVSTNAKDAWLEEIHNGGFMATNWRPILALTCTFLILWDGVLISIVNGILLGLGAYAIGHTPQNVMEVAMWLLLTLVGARGIEKIGVISRKGK